MISKRWTGVGLVTFLALPGVVAAQEADPPPGAAVDPPPGAAVDPPPGAASSELPPNDADWGDDLGDADAESDEGIPETGSDELDTGVDEAFEPDARDRSLSESNSLGGATGLM